MLKQCKGKVEKDLNLSPHKYGIQNASQSLSVQKVSFLFDVLCSVQ